MNALPLCADCGEQLDDPSTEQCESCKRAEDGPMDDDWIHAAYERRADAGLPV